MTKVREIYMATLAGTSMLTRTVYVYLPADFSESGYDPDSDCWFGHSAVSLAHARAAIGIDPCPVCGGHPRKLAYCLQCDRTGMDHIIGGRWPGKPVGSAMRDDETARKYRGQPKYQPTGMKGGKG